MHHRANLARIALCVRARLRASKRQRSRDMKQELQQRQMAAISLKELLSRVSLQLSIQPESQPASQQTDCETPPKMKTSSSAASAVVSHVKHFIISPCPAFAINTASAQTVRSGLRAAGSFSWSMAAFLGMGNRCHRCFIGSSWLTSRLGCHLVFLGANLANRTTKRK